MSIKSFLFKFNLIVHPRSERVLDGKYKDISASSEVISTSAIDTEDFGEDKIVFDSEKKSLLGKENNTRNKIIKVGEICYDYFKEIIEPSSITDDLDEIIDVFKSKDMDDKIESMNETINNLSESKPVIPEVSKKSNKFDTYNEVDGTAIGEINLKKNKTIKETRVKITDDKNYTSTQLNLKDSIKKENIKDEKNNFSSSNPFKKNYEVDVLSTSKTLINYY